MAYLYCDTETYSATPIRNGHYRYAEDVEITLFAYAVGTDGDIEVVDLTSGETLPEDIQYMLVDPAVTKVFHNSAFDRAVIRGALDIDIPVSQIHDTMVQALAHALPAGLSQLCVALDVPVDLAKEKTGKSLINLFCKPRPKNWTLDRATKETHPEEWAQFIDYAGNDIASMRYIHGKMPNWNYEGMERRLWELDQKINDRGFEVDLELATAAVKAIKKSQKKLSKRTQDITDNEVERTTQRDKLLKHLVESYGVHLPDMQKATIEKRLQDPDLPVEVKELLSIRQKASTTSTSKYNALIRSVGHDGRLRGTLQYDGAARTRRWAGRIFQPQNLPRPTHRNDDILQAIEAVKLNVIDLIDPDDVIGLMSSAVRGCIKASPNKKLYVSDLSNIEGRKGAWFANENWKLQAFRDYDNGTGHDLYKVAYGKAFNVDPASVDKDDRQIGKVMELMLQYGGGVGAFLTGALTYGIDLDFLAGTAWPKLPGDIQQEARAFHQWQMKQGRSDYGLKPPVYMAMDGLKRLWREAHPNIAALWKELENGARKAIKNPKTKVRVRRVIFYRSGSWLRCVLPSGACLCYPAPQIDEKGQISYMGVHPYTRKWKRLRTYGGKLLENICQSSARDVMAWRMLPVEDAGYNTVLTVHDELITEAPDTGEYSHEHLSALLETNPEWCKDLPLAAGGFEDYRYRKD